MSSIHFRLVPDATTGVRLPVPGGEEDGRTAELLTAAIHEREAAFGAEADGDRAGSFEHRERMRASALQARASARQVDNGGTGQPPGARDA